MWGYNLLTRLRSGYGAASEWHAFAIRLRQGYGKLRASARQASLLQMRPESQTGAAM